MDIKAQDIVQQRVEYTAIAKDIPLKPTVHCFIIVTYGMQIYYFDNREC